ncbi:MAG: SRPBCC family protein [Gemmatimonadota bacterium]
MKRFHFRHRKGHCPELQHEEHSGAIHASAERVFELLDDQTRLTEHMSKRSWKLGWGKMETVLDAQRGRSVGSHIVLRGRVFGVRLHLDEVVTRRDPPLGKTWETVGEPRLLVMGPYHMGFDLAPVGAQTNLRVVIDYELPAKGISWVLGRLLGRSYARWCTRRMVREAQHAFTR